MQFIVEASPYVLNLRNYATFDSTPFLVAILTLTGCVTMKQFEELQDSCEEIDHENTKLRLGAQDAQIENKELKGSIETLTKAREQLAADTARMGRFVSEAEDEISRLRDLNDALTDQNGGRLSIK